MQRSSVDGCKSTPTEIIKSEGVLFFDYGLTAFATCRTSVVPRALRAGSARLLGLHWWAVRCSYSNFLPVANR